MPRTSSPDGLAGLLEQQSSVVSRAQLLALGMKDRAMQYRVRKGGPWQKLLPGVYMATTGVPSLHQKELAALLYAGPGSMVTGPMALLHHGIRSGSGVDVIDVLVPVGRQRVSAGFARLHRTARMPTRASLAGQVRLALVPRAVADTVRQLTELREVRAVIADAVQLGRCTVGQLAEELRIGPVKGSAMFRSVLAEVADGIRSTAEGDLRDLIETARLPMPCSTRPCTTGTSSWASPTDGGRTPVSPARSIRAPGTCPPKTGIAPGAVTTGWPRRASSCCISPRVSSGMNVAFCTLFCAQRHIHTLGGPGQGVGVGSAFGEGEGHFLDGEQGGDVEGEELAAVHDGLQAAEGGLGGGGGGELAQVGLGVGELHSGA
jgi:hypothetical protein